jgi:hypothetical protein
VRAGLLDEGIYGGMWDNGNSVVDTSILHFDLSNFEILPTWKNVVRTFSMLYVSTVQTVKANLNQEFDILSSFNSPKAGLYSGLFFLLPV